MIRLDVLSVLDCVSVGLQQCDGVLDPLEIIQIVTIP